MLSLRLTVSLETHGRSSVSPVSIFLPPSSLPFAFFPSPPPFQCSMAGGRRRGATGWAEAARRAGATQHPPLPSHSVPFPAFFSPSPRPSISPAAVPMARPPSPSVPHILPPTGEIANLGGAAAVERCSGGEAAVQWRAAGRRRRSEGEVRGGPTTADPRQRSGARRGGGGGSAVAVADPRRSGGARRIRRGRVFFSFFLDSQIFYFWMT